MNISTIEHYIEPLLKWPGGKQDELNIILPLLPSNINNYYEPFLGGGAVYLTIPSSIPAYVNDKSEDLINLYQMVSQQDKTFLCSIEFVIRYSESLEKFVTNDADFLVEQYYKYGENKISDDEIRAAVKQFIQAITGDLITPLKLNLPQNIDFYSHAIHESLFEKIKRMRSLMVKKGILIEEDVRDNFEAAVKAAFYYYIRHLYNYSAKYDLTDEQKAALFFFIRENAYASMFRFNKNGHFNIPYGGISYNRKNMRAKLRRFQNQTLLNRLVNTKFGNSDFEGFLQKYPPQKDDFIFLDPPYDSEFSSYDQNPFDKIDQERLAHFLIRECKANFMLVIKSTPFILSLYENRNLKIRDFDKKYMYTVKERNNRDVIHLLITNY